MELRAMKPPPPPHHEGHTNIPRVDFTSHQLLMKSTIVTCNYSMLDKACERTRRELQQVLVNRKKAFARGKESSKDSEDSENSTKKEYTNAFAAPIPGQSRAARQWAKKVRTAIINYTKAENSAIIARIQDLARELRDNIYLHLWEPYGNKDPTRDLLYWWQDADEPWMIGGVDSSKSQSLANTSDLRPPHFVDLTFVKKEFATEVLEQFKDTIGKDLRFVGDKAPVAEFLLDHEEIEAFVTNDVVGVGTTMEELVRNLDLQIEFDCDELEDLNHQYSSEDEWSHHSEDSETLCRDDERSSIKYDKRTATENIELDKEKYLNNLDQSITILLSIPYTERMIIHNGVSRCLEIRPRIVTLVIRHDCADIEESMVPIMRLICRACNGLKDKGFATKVRFDSGLGLKVLFEDDTWSWTEEDWRKNLEDKNTSSVEAQDRDAQKMAAIWSHLKTALFSTPHIEP